MVLIFRTCQLLDFSHNKNKFYSPEQDMTASLKKIAAFLEIKRGDKIGQLTDEEIEKLKNHLAFSNMSKNPATNNEMLNSAAIVSSQAKDVKFMRKGIVSSCQNSVVPFPAD